MDAVSQKHRLKRCPPSLRWFGQLDSHLCMCRTAVGPSLLVRSSSFTLHQSFNFVLFLKVVSNTFLSQLVCFFKMSTWILNFIILANEHFGKNFILIDLTSVVLEHATDLHLPNLQLCSKYSIYQVCQHLYSNLSLSI